VYGQTTEKPVFSGKRIKRGLYRTDRGFLCQSDVMGSYNIWFFGLCYAMDGGYKGWNPYARKAFGDFCQLFLI
jgi:hypothetical protein